ncbi:MAG: alanine racemase [Xanthomonadaceae bacterium]|jgi:alanine racemase|nr:alanine racemase [Xanthomonadaceae bacterium]
MRPARALIDLAAFRHNYRLGRELAGGRALAIVKADAYGHGSVECARAVENEADGFGVACIEEALTLRAAGIRAPILLLEGFFDADELPLISEYGLWTAVQADWQVQAIEAASLSRPLRVWLKLDSGMHRLGLAPEHYRDVYARLIASPKIAAVVPMTHFARADELDDPRTAEQAEVFAAIIDTLGTDSRSLCNSAGLLGWSPLGDGTWGRAGLMLYGISPFPQPHPVADRLKPVMRVESRIIAVRELGTGEPIGYGARFTTVRPTRIGVVAAGYADGYPQFAPNGTPVAIEGRPGQLIGRVSMDMLTVDLTDHPQAGLGSQVELWGGQVPAAELARRGGTSAYQLLCGLKRMPRLYQGG